jgi:cupin fold WbuC family metalloprotein
MDKIYYKKELLGIRVKKLKGGSLSATDESGPLQLLTLKQKKGHVVTPHSHKPVKRTTESLQECIVVLKGKVRVDLYGSEKKVVKRVIVKQGEAFITISGGHSIHFLEDTEIIETKNGPFASDRISL